MKKILFFLVAVVITANLFAQAPDRFSYQAVVRSSSGLAMPNQLVNFRISILQGSASGTVVYSETKQLTTSAGGLADFSVGSGSIVSGTMASINWGGNTHFLKLEMDATGGNTFVLMGTTQLLSVPYSLNAKKAESLQVPFVASANSLNDIINISNSGTGVAIRGVNTSATGNVAGVVGSSISPDGTGVYGASVSPTGNTSGVAGTSSSPNGAGGTFGNTSTGGHALVTQQGDVKLGDLSGTGTRMVVAGADGTLGTQAAPNSQWTTNGNNISNSNTGKVGIGTYSPNADVNVAAGKNVLFGADTTTNGAKLWWIPGKNALRVGLQANGLWDSIGNVSTGLGASEASGDYSTAFGTSLATKLFATAGGHSEAMGEKSTAFGFSTAKGEGSTAAGNFTMAKSMGGVALGSFNDTLDAPNPVTSAPTDRLFQLGNGNAYYDRSNALTVLRNGNIGIGTTVPDALLHVSKDADVWHAMIGGATGRLLIGGQSLSGSVLQSWNPTANTPRDMYLQRDGGNVGIGTNTPGAKLEVAGQVKITGGTPGSGKVLTSDANGLASWQDGTGNQWTTNGNNIYNNNTGNVGIGTNNPSAKQEITCGSNHITTQLKLTDTIQNNYTRLTLDNTHSTNFWTLAGLNTDSAKNDKFGFFHSTGGDIMQMRGDGRVGIGTQNPKAPFNVAAGKTVLFGADTSGGGSKMMWIPSKSAFRAGNAFNADWNKDSIGESSFATGENTKAKGGFSFASGRGSSATGAYSTAMGASTAKGNVSTALGGSVASGDYSFASSYSQAKGGQSTSMGFGVAQGVASTAMGGSTAKGQYSTAMGITKSKAFNSLSIGAYNDTSDSPNPDLPANTDRIFQIGNGYFIYTYPYTYDYTYSNALTVLRNGNIGTGSILAPTEKLELDGALKIGNTLTNNAGTIKYDGTDLQGYVGGQWKSLTTGGGNSDFTTTGNNTYQTNTTNGTVSLGASAGLPTTKLSITGNSTNPIGLYIAPGTGGAAILTSGAVGINTITPAAGVALDVNGAVKINGGNPGNGKVLTSDANGIASWQTPSGGTNYSAGSGINISGGNVISTVPQTLSVSTNQLTLSNGGGTVTLPTNTYTGGTGIVVAGSTVNALHTTNIWNANKLQGNNVSTTTPTNGQSLVWNNTTSQWEPQTVSGGGGSSPWTVTGNDINNSNTGKVLMGDAPFLTGSFKPRFQIRDNTTTSGGNQGTLASITQLSTSYSAALYVADSAFSGNPKGSPASGQPGNVGVQAFSRYGDAFYGNTQNGRGLYIKGGNDFGNYPAAQIENRGGATFTALTTVGGVDITGFLKVNDGNQQLGRVLTSDANGYATWQTPSGGGAAYTAGTGISITSNVISATAATTYTAGTGIAINNGVISALAGGGSASGWTSDAGGHIYNNAWSADGAVGIGTDVVSGDIYRLKVIGSTNKPIAAKFTNLDAANGGRAIEANGSIYATSGIRVGDFPLNPNSTYDGTIRYDGVDFFGRVNGMWKSMTTGGASYTAGTGINITGSTISSAAQTLSLSGSDLTLSGGGGTITLPAGGGGGSGWGLTGNAGNSASTNFIGNTDNVDLVFKTNNVEGFRISSGGAILANGNTTTGTLPISGAGTRMMWAPYRGAFRAGTVTGSHWNDFNMGFYSAAFGQNCIASGLASFATGDGSSAGGNSSFAAGKSASAGGANSVALGYTVSANQAGSFCFGDQDFSNSLSASTTNQMNMRFSNGYRLFTTSQSTGGSAIGVSLAAGGNSWAMISDVRRKENFVPVNGEDFLNKIATFNLTSWNYKGQDAKTFRHYGPMAQDFYKAFGKDALGTVGNDTTISSGDFDGINFVAIQALVKRTADLQKQNDKLVQENIQMLQNIESLTAIISSERSEIKAKLEMMETMLKSQNNVEAAVTTKK